MNVTTLVATLYCHEARGGARHAVALGGTLRDPVRAPHDVLVSEVSATGFRIPATVALAPGDSITLGLAGIGARAARVVREDAGGQYGCAFVSPRDDAELAALLAPPADPVVPWPTPAPPAETSIGDGVQGTRALLLTIAACLAGWIATIWAAFRLF